MEKKVDFNTLLRNHSRKHKSKPVQFNSTADGVKNRLEQNVKRRRSSRLTLFDTIRNIQRMSRHSESPAPAPVVTKAQQRKEQLEKWKAEKEKRKKEIASMKKKPFITGIPHNPLKYVPPPPARPVPSTSGRVTRSQAARYKIIQEKAQESFAPINAGFCPQINLSTLPKFGVDKHRNKKAAFNFEPVVNNLSDKNMIFNKPSKNMLPDIDVKKSTASVKKDSKTKLKQSKNSKTLNKPNQLGDKNVLHTRMSVAMSTDSSSSDNCTESSSTEKESDKDSPRNVKMETKKKSISRKSTPKQSLTPKSESKAEERLRSPKSPDLNTSAQKISPKVTMSRGKDNARREMKQKLDDGLLDEDASDMDNVDHFRRQLASETERLTKMCDTWEQISEQVVLPDFVQELVLGAVGQCRLLVRQKLAQFGALVQRCAAPEPRLPLVTPADLHGFWDMVFMQVVNVDIRFKKLEELKARNWSEEPAQAEPRARARVAKPAAKPRVVPSRIKEMIAAARKAKKQQPSPQEEKTFEAGFFSVRSPLQSAAPTPATPRDNGNLLKAVLSSEAKKASASKQSSFAILRASIMGRDVDFDGVAPLPPTPKPQIDLSATPGRSILKTPAKSGKTPSRVVKAVLFDKPDSASSSSDELPQDISKESQDMCKEPQDMCKEPQDISKEPQDIEKSTEKSKRRSKLVRQSNVEYSPVMTRSMRKSIYTPEVKEMNKEPSRRSSRKAFEEKTNAEENVTPKRSSRRKSGRENL